MVFERLGFEVTSRAVGPDGETPVAYLRLGECELEMFESEDGPPGLDHLGLRVDDVTAAAATLGDRGIAAQGGPVQATRGGTAILLDAATTSGVRMHLCQP